MNEVLLEHAPQQPLSYAVIVSKLVDAALQTKAALSIPSVGEYNDALWTASSDVYRAMSTTSRLVIMTLQPFCLLLLIAGRLVSNALVKLAGPVAYTAAKQLQIYLQKLIHWQLHLEPRHVGMELVAVGSFVLVWYLRKWLMRQTYTRRVKTWASRRRLAASRKYEQSRLKLVQIYTRAVHRISRVSSICGVLIPHVLFWILCLFLHQLFPSIMVYLATQTMLTTCLSKLLPLVCSVLLAHDVQMYSKSMARSSDGVDGDTKNTTAASGKRKDSTEIQTPARRRSGLSMFARTHPLSSQSGRRKSSTGTSTPSAATDEWSLDDRLHFWICYWMVHASVSLAILALQTVPIFGWQLVKLAKRYSALLQTLELLCYVWLYVMPYLLVQQRHGDLDGRPLQLLRRTLEPIYEKLVDNVSSVVSPATWNKYIVTPTTPILHVLATVRIVSPQTRDWLLLALQQGQQLVLPCVWLLLPLPGCSVLAVLYVQWVLPLAKSVSACRESAARRGVVAETRQIKRPSTTAAANKKAALNMPLDPVDQTIVAAADHEWSMLVTLEYWIINTLLTMLLNVLASLLWWIPLINIFLFVVWWSLTLKVVVTKVYGVLQRDLTLLGILASHNHDDDGDDKDAKVPVLYRAVCWILARLPSAAERKDDAAAADDDDDDDDDDGQEDIGQEDDEDDGQEDADNEPTSEQQQQQQHDLVDDNDNDDNDDESNDEPVNEDSEDEPVVYTGSYSRTSTVETATAPSPVRRSLRNLAKK
ncbi:hypothetical protein MPSEU_000761600 [Mayamaea pseudoterrestris]|nr:hypothetical protein MPSEU_000761600 [Mayamaea pseudoterrestris]